MTTQQISLKEAAKAYHESLAELAKHEKEAAAESGRIRGRVERYATILKMSEQGIDAEKVALAETIVYAWDHRNGGSDWQSCRADAIKQFATGLPITQYCDLWRRRFATKNYDRWTGQREDHEYGYGPKHGSMCFEIGLTKQARARSYSDLSGEEIEAAVYYLVNLERIQLAREEAKKIPA
jgi:hypothetical protein